MKSRRSYARKLWVEELEGRVVPSAVPVPVLSTSLNWSGYAVQAPTGSVTAVSGKWVVPTVSGSGYSSSWVGIDGWNSPTVEQIGTEADSSGRQTSYYAWFEMYPANSVEVKMTVQPGDSIAAQVSYAAGTFTLSLQDVTRNESFSTTQAGNYYRSSAEWVLEAPSSYSVLPLDNFGTESFSAAQATIGGKTGPINNSTWTGTTVEEINMAGRRGNTEDTTSTLTDAGTPATSSFTVTAATTTSTGGSGNGGHGGHGGWWWHDPNAPTQLNTVVPFLLNNATTLSQLSGPYATPPSTLTARPTFGAPATLMTPSLFDSARPHGTIGGTLDLLSSGNSDDGQGDGKQPGQPGDRQAPQADPDTTPQPPVNAGEARTALPHAPLVARQIGDAVFADGHWTSEPRPDSPAAPVVAAEMGSTDAAYAAGLLAALFVDPSFLRTWERDRTRRRWKWGR